MASPMRLDPELVGAAEKEGAVQKRTAPKQIEFWAELGKAVERLLAHTDVIAILQGFKKIRVELEESVTINPDDIFSELEKNRKIGALAEKVTSSAMYYEVSQKQPGLLDRVDSATGKRETGMFQNGEFKVQG